MAKGPYNEIVMDHFMNPRNVGEIEDANAVGEAGSGQCGDSMTLYLKIEDDKIQDAKFMTFGCGAAIASSSMMTELLKGGHNQRAFWNEHCNPRGFGFPCGRGSAIEISDSSRYLSRCGSVPGRRTILFAFF